MVGRSFSPADFIVAHMPVAPVSGLPLRLHGATPKSGVWRLAGENTPYWAWCWPGGLALAHHVLSIPQSLAERSVLDLGTGSGLVAVAARLAGASAVIACDIDPNAIAAARLNAALNGVAIDLLEADLLDGPAPQIDVVLVGDLFYATDLATRVCAFLDRCRQRGSEILVGDIGRPALPRHRLEPLSFWPVPDVGDTQGAEPRRAGVYRLNADDHRSEPLQSCA